VAPYATSKTLVWIKEQYAGVHASLPMPLGIARTDALMLKLSELFEKPVPASLKTDRGRAVDAITDRSSIHCTARGSPCMVIQTRCLGSWRSCSKWAPCRSTSCVPRLEEAGTRAASAARRLALRQGGQDLHEPRSVALALPAHDRPSGRHHRRHARQVRRARRQDPALPFGFPIFDRVNLHRRPIIGYQGVINMVTEICNKFIDIKDETCEDRFFEMMR